jgi:protein-tyrosine phosphatase
MLPHIYKVIEKDSGTLSVMAKPVAGEWIEDEFSGLKRLGVDRVVSLLESDEEREVGLSSERELCLDNDIEFSSFPIPDRGLPNSDKALNFANAIYLDICSGKHIVIHCRAGIGRTGIMAGAVLRNFGFSATDAFELISSKRGVRVPDTEEQEQWLGSL